MTTGSTSGANLGWLDEELRRHKTIVEELRNVIDKQQVTLVDQSQRIISLEDRLTRLQNQLLAIPEVRQTMQNTRDEIVAMMGDLRQDVQKRETEALRTRQAEREKDVRALQEVRGELDRLAPLEQGLVVGRAEDRRLNEGLSRLQQQIEGLAKAVPQQDEGRRALADEIAKNATEIGRMGEQVEELRASRPPLVQRLLGAENTVSKQAQQIGELQNMRQEMTAQQSEMLERQRRTERERAQTMAEWGRRLDGFAHQVEAWAEQLRFFTDQHEKNRRVLRDTQTLAQDLSQQQDRLRQLQAVGEEQLRRELREGRAENDQRWAQELERREQSRREQEQLNDQQDQRLADLDGALQDLVLRAQGIEAGVRVLVSRMDAEGAQSRETLHRVIQVMNRELDDLVASLAEIYGVQG